MIIDKAIAQLFVLEEKISSGLKEPSVWQAVTSCLLLYSKEHSKSLNQIQVV